MINVLRAHFLNSKLCFFIIKILNHPDATAVKSISLKFYATQIFHHRLNTTLENSLSKFSASVGSSQR